MSSLKISSHSNFQKYNTALFIAIVMLYVILLGHLFCKCKFVPLTTFRLLEFLKGGLFLNLWLYVVVGNNWVSPKSLELTAIKPS